MKKKWLNYLPTIFIICIIVSLMMYSSSSTSENLNFTQFEKKAEKVEFKDSSITIESTIIQVEGTYKTNDKVTAFKAIIPNTDKNIEWLEETLSKDGGQITVTNPDANKVWVSMLAQMIPFLIIAVVFYLMMAKMGGGSNAKAFEFAKSRARMENDVKVRFKDVAGCEEEKEEVKEIIDYLKTPKRFTDMGAHIPKGVLMVGPPGTGKTLLAKAVAGEANVPFFSISGSDFVEMFVGTGASRVRDMFKNAQKNAPCIVFIDEIDAVGRQRGTGLGGGHDEREQTLNQLLTEMDGFGANEGIIIIAATNRPDVLDPALLRPGRFDRQVTVSLPDQKERKAILEVHARNKVFDKSVNLENISKRTPGFSGADLENLLNEAALLAVRRNLPAITMAEIDEATDRVLMGPAKVSHKITPKEKELIALHESGHAVIGMKVPDAEVVHKITIIPRGVAGGYTMMLPKEEKIAIMTKSELLSTITGLLGGRVSEELFFGEITTGASDDFSKATKIARSMVTEYGMSDLGPVQLEQKSEGVFLGRDYNKSKNFSDAVALEIDQEVRKIMNQCYSEATRILKENEKLVRLLADTLIERETITKEEIEELVETGHISDNFTPSEDTVSLKERAKVLGVKGYTKMTDEELKKAIEKAEDSSK